MKTKLLLCGVFKPYGIKDAYGEGVGMEMDPLSNQLMREQGVHRIHQNYWTTTLYFLAENLQVPTTILDFPSWNDFKKELKKGYTHIGINFIQANVIKARRMAQYIRKHHPNIKIILGGYGALVDDIDKIVSHDEICTGEGVKWLREYFGENPNRDIKHPTEFGVAQKHFYGMKDPTINSSYLIPGLGCPNKCFFCSTGNKYENYFSILKDGQEMFTAMRKAENKIGAKYFMILDENFLKYELRAIEMLKLMEKHEKTYRFAMWSSAETIKKLGIDFLVRMGVSLVWIGVESKKIIFPKMKNIDIKQMVEELQSKGVSVITSSILFLEHHNRKNLGEDIDWAIDLNADLHQFHNLVTCHGTPIHKKYKQEGRLIPGYSHKRMHAQDDLNFVHKNFARPNAKKVLTCAFKKKYQRCGPGTMNMALTLIRGYLNLSEEYSQRLKNGIVWNDKKLKYVKSSKNPKDRFIELRIEELRETARNVYPFLYVINRFSPNKRTKEKCKKVIRLYRKTFGPLTSMDMIKRIIVTITAQIEHTRLEMRQLLGLGDLVRQPPCQIKKYRQ